MKKHENNEEPIELNTGNEEEVLEFPADEVEETSETEEAESSSDEAAETDAAETEDPEAFYRMVHNLRIS